MFTLFPKGNKKNRQNHFFISTLLEKCQKVIRETSLYQLLAYNKIRTLYQPNKNKWQIN